MDPNDESQLEHSLKGLSWWEGPTPSAWKRALIAGAATADERSDRLSRFLRSPWPWIGLPIAAMIAVAVVSSLVGTAAYRNEGVYLASSVTPSAPVARQADLYLASTMLEVDEDGTVPSRVQAVTESVNGRPNGPAVAADNGAMDGRHVTRKASIDLEAEDVRGVYLKVLKMIPNEALGEYIEDSQIHDSDATLQAYVTLRVRNDRLSEVLSALRELGHVAHESTQSEDVTTQVVDLEARLRNEQRVEKELLALIDKREDAPLQEVLKLSESVAAVRERIEKLVAQREHIGRQVALATVVVSIWSRDARAPATGTIAELGHKLSAAWREGSSYLTTSIAVLVQVIVGGLIWWIALCVAVWLTRRWYLRRGPQGQHQLP